VATASRPRFGRHLLSRRNGNSQNGVIFGTARLGRKTKHLVKRLGPGDIAVIDHTNIDRIAAEELIATGAEAVINVSDSSNGRYPNAGPLMMTRAGIHLVDAPRAPLFEQLKDGDPLTIEGGRVIRGGEEIVTGTVMETEALARQLDEQRQRVDDALSAFAENTMAHVRQEGDLLTGRVEFPAIRT
jgi:uncharacterized membrane-anchored protein